MSRKARLRAAAVAAAVLALGLLLATNAARGTWAFFAGSVQNSSSTLAGGWIPAPTSLSVSPAGYGGSLSWTPGSTPPSPTPITGQQLWGYDAGTTNSCTQSSEANIATMAGAGTTSYTDPESSAVNGHYFCWWMRETSATVWYTEGAFSPAPLQVGLVATSVSWSNGKGLGTPDDNDSVTITFNQNVNGPSGTVTLCQIPGASNTGAIYLGDSTCAGAGDTYTIGSLSGLTEGSLKSVLATASTSGNTITVTIQVGQKGKPTSDNAPTFIPAASLTSSVGSANACTSATYGCTPTATGTGF